MKAAASALPINASDIWTASAIIHVPEMAASRQVGPLALPSSARARRNREPIYAGR